jgi:hypothetical protein
VHKEQSQSDFLFNFISYIIKELVQPKMSLNRKERGRGEREKGVGERGGGQTSR